MKKINLLILCFTISVNLIQSQECKFQYQKVDKFTGVEEKGFKYPYASRAVPSFGIELMLLNCRPELRFHVSAGAKVNHNVSAGSEIVLVLGEGEILKAYTSGYAPGNLSYVVGFAPTAADLTNVPNSGIYTDYVLKVHLTKEMLTKLSSLPIKDVRIPQIPYCIKDYSVINNFGKKIMKGAACILSVACEEKMVEPTSKGQQPNVKSNTETNSSSGTKDGPYTQKHSNGKTAAIGEMKAGKKVGVWKIYSDNEALMSEETYNSEGQLHGIYTEYRNGVVYSKKEYKNGVIDGKVLSYLNGALSNEYEYKNGEREGLQKDYYPNGKVSKEIYLKEGKRNGKEIDYNKLGVKLKETNFVNDIEEGKCIYYYEVQNGQKYKEGMMKNNRKEGIWTEYDVKGKLRNTITYKDGTEIK